MGYLFLSLAVATSKIKAYCSKKISSITKNNLNYFALSLVRMLLCAIIGFFFVVLITNDVKNLATDQTTLIISAVSGFSSAMFVVTWLISVKTSAFTMLDVFITLGITIPLLFSHFLFNEYISFIQWIGIILLVVSVYIMCLYSSRTKSKLSFKNLLVLAVCGFFNGLSHFTEKWFIYHAHDMLENGKVSPDTSVFNFYTYIFATIILAMYFFVFKTLLKKRQPLVFQKFDFPIKRTFFIILIMSVCLFLHSYFCTLAAGILPASKLYPLQQGLSLVVTVLMSKYLFKEKVTFGCILGVFLAFVSLLVINLLPTLINS